MSSVQTQYSPVSPDRCYFILTARPETMRTAPDYVTATLLPTLVRVGYLFDLLLTPAHVHRQKISSDPDPFLIEKRQLPTPKFPPGPAFARTGPPANTLSVRLNAWPMAASVTPAVEPVMLC